jgi:hypothetical protein
MTVVRWCCSCQRVSEPEADTPSGVLVCALCGSDASNLQTWSSIRAHNPHWPVRPKTGKAYRVRKLGQR